MLGAVSKSSIPPFQTRIRFSSSRSCYVSISEGLRQEIEAFNLSKYHFCMVFKLEPVDEKRQISHFDLKAFSGLASNVSFGGNSKENASGIGGGSAVSSRESNTVFVGWTGSIISSSRDSGGGGRASSALQSQLLDKYDYEGGNNHVIQISEQLGNCYGLKDGQICVLTIEQPSRKKLWNVSQQQVFLAPREASDWERLQYHANHLEEHLLEQVSVVSSTRSFPVWIHSQHPLYLKVDVETAARALASSAKPADEGTVESTEGLPDYYLLSLETELVIAPPPANLLNRPHQRARKKLQLRRLNDAYFFGRFVPPASEDASPSVCFRVMNIPEKIASDFLSDFEKLLESPRRQGGGGNIEKPTIEGISFANPEDIYYFQSDNEDDFTHSFISAKYGAKGAIVWISAFLEDTKLVQQGLNGSQDYFVNIRPRALTVILPHPGTPAGCISIPQSLRYFYQWPLASWVYVRRITSHPVVVSKLFLTPILLYDEVYVPLPYPEQDHLSSPSPPSSTLHYRHAAVTEPLSDRSHRKHQSYVCVSFDEFLRSPEGTRCIQKSFIEYIRVGEEAEDLKLHAHTAPRVPSSSSQSTSKKQRCFPGCVTSPDGRLRKYFFPSPIWDNSIISLPVKFCRSKIQSFASSVHARKVEELLLGEALKKCTANIFKAADAEEDAESRSLQLRREAEKEAKERNAMCAKEAEKRSSSVCATPVFEDGIMGTSHTRLEPLTYPKDYQLGIDDFYGEEEASMADIRMGRDVEKGLQDAFGKSLTYKQPSSSLLGENAHLSPPQTDHGAGVVVCGLSSSSSEASKGDPVMEFGLEPGREREAQLGIAEVDSGLPPSREGKAQKKLDFLPSSNTLVKSLEETLTASTENLPPSGSQDEEAGEPIPPRSEFKQPFEDDTAARKPLNESSRILEDTEDSTFSSVKNVEPSPSVNQSSGHDDVSSIVSAKEKASKASTDENQQHLADSHASSLVAESSQSAVMSSSSSPSSSTSSSSSSEDKLHSLAPYSGNTAFLLNEADIGEMDIYYERRLPNEAVDALKMSSSKHKETVVDATLRSGITLGEQSLLSQRESSVLYALEESQMNYSSGKSNEKPPRGSLQGGIHSQTREVASEEGCKLFFADSSNLQGVLSNDLAHTPTTKQSEGGSHLQSDFSSIPPFFEALSPPGGSADEVIVIVHLLVTFNSFSLVYLSSNGMKCLPSSLLRLEDELTTSRRSPPGTSLGSSTHTYISDSSVKSASIEAENASHTHRFSQEERDAVLSPRLSKATPGGGFVGVNESYTSKDDDSGAAAVMSTMESIGRSDGAMNLHDLLGASSSSSSAFSASCSSPGTSSSHSSSTITSASSTVATSHQKHEIPSSPSVAQASTPSKASIADSINIDDLLNELFPRGRNEQQKPDRRSHTFLDSSMDEAKSGSDRDHIAQSQALSKPAIPPATHITKAQSTSSGAAFLSSNQGMTAPSSSLLSSTYPPSTPLPSSLNASTPLNPLPSSTAQREGIDSSSLLSLFSPISKAIKGATMAATSTRNHPPLAPTDSKASTQSPPSIPQRNALYQQLEEKLISKKTIVLNFPRFSYVLPFYLGKSLLEAYQSIVGQFTEAKAAKSLSRGESFFNETRSSVVGGANFAGFFDISTQHLSRPKNLGFQADHTQAFGGVFSSITIPKASSGRQMMSLPTSSDFGVSSSNVGGSSSACPSPSFDEARRMAAFQADGGSQSDALMTSRLSGTTKPVCVYPPVLSTSSYRLVSYPTMSHTLLTNPVMFFLPSAYVLKKLEKKEIAVTLTDSSLFLSHSSQTQTEDDEILPPTGEDLRRKLEEEMNAFGVCASDERSAFSLPSVDLANAGESLFSPGSSRSALPPAKSLETSRASWEYTQASNVQDSGLTHESSPENLTPAPCTSDRSGSSSFTRWLKTGRLSVPKELEQGTPKARMEDQPQSSSIESLSSLKEAEKPAKSRESLSLEEASSSDHAELEAKLADLNWWLEELLEARTWMRKPFLLDASGGRSPRVFGAPAHAPPLFSVKGDPPYLKLVCEQAQSSSTVKFKVSLNRGFIEKIHRSKSWWINRRNLLDELSSLQEGEGRGREDHHLVDVLLENCLILPFGGAFAGKTAGKKPSKDSAISTSSRASASTSNEVGGLKDAASLQALGGSGSSSIGAVEEKPTESLARKITSQHEACRSPYDGKKLFLGKKSDLFEDETVTKQTKNSENSELVAIHGKELSFFVDSTSSACVELIGEDVAKQLFTIINEEEVESSLSSDFDQFVYRDAWGDAYEESKLAALSQLQIIEEEGGRYYEGKSLLATEKASLRLPHLVCGPSGSGKSALCKSLASDLVEDYGVFAIWMNCSLLLNENIKFKSIQTVFMNLLLSLARFSPSAVVLDDLDLICASSSAKDAQAHNVTPSTERSLHLSEFLSEILAEFTREISQNGRIAVFATAKSIESLNSALKAPLLFRQSITHMKPLSTELKTEYMQAMMKSFEVSCASKSPKIFVEKEVLSDDTLKKMTVLTEGYSFGDIKDMLRLLKVEATAGWRSRSRGAILGGSSNAEDLQSNAIGVKIKLEDLNSTLESFEPLAIQNAKVSKKAAKKLVDLQSVGGLRRAKKALKMMISLPRQFSLLCRNTNFTTQQGALLIGPPGCGKTFLAGAMQTEFQLRCITVKGPELLSKYIGASEEAVRNVFERANQAAPSMIFFDEIEALAPTRGKDSSGVTDRVVNQLLCYLDGLESRKEVFILAASSRPDMVDPAVMRPGRLDKICYCGIPSVIEKAEIVSLFAKAFNLTDQHDTEAANALAASLPVLFTPSDIQTLFQRAKLNCIKAYMNEDEKLGLSSVSADNLDKKSSKESSKKRMSGNLLSFDAVSRLLADTKPSISLKDALWYNRLYRPFLNPDDLQELQTFEEDLLSEMRNSPEVPMESFFGAPPPGNRSLSKSNANKQKVALM